MGENLLGLMAVSALLALATIVLLTLRARRQALAFVVGISAGLFGVQFVQVHVFTVVVIIWALLSFGRGVKPTLPREAVALVLAASLLASTALFGELVNNPPLGLQLLALTLSAAAIIATANSEDVRWMLYGLLAITSFSAAFGLLQVAGVIPTDVWHLSISALGRPTGIYPEPDWLGMYSGIGLVLAWRLKMVSWLRVFLIVITFSAFVLAFARAGWIATVASAALALVVSAVIRSRAKKPTEEAKKGSGRAIGVLATVLVGAIALNAIPVLHDNLITRLSRTLTVAADDVSAQARVQQNDALLYLADSAPWYGWGLSSSGRVGVSGRLNFGKSDNNVGSNWITSMWVDGSWLAVPLILMLVLGCVVAVRTLQGQLLVLVLLSSLFSNATFQPITWFLLALCLLYARQGRESSTALARPRSYERRRATVALSAQ